MNWPVFKRVIPNILTMLGLCGGIIAIRFSIDNCFKEAVISLVFSAIIDGLDGRIARILNGSTKFGAQFDSLSDFLCFGVGPAFLLYYWSLQGGGRYAFLPCIIFTVCMALRLARFNSHLEDNFLSNYASNFFVGVPAPAGAGLALFPIFLGLESQKLKIDWLYQLTRQPWISSIILVCTALLLVSTLPIWSCKKTKIKRKYLFVILISFLLYLALVIFQPWATFAFSGIIYLILIPFSYYKFLKLK